MAAPHRVVILGGGFAGVRVARRLARSSQRQHLAVTLVSRDGTHTYAPGLYQLAGAVTDGSRRKAMDRGFALPLRRVLAGLPVTLLEGEVTGIDCDARGVTLRDGRTISYDTLVIALGSEAAYYGIPGLQEHAITLKSLKDANRVNQTIAALMRGRDKPVRITVGGGGPTGVEVSAMLAEKIGAWQAGIGVTLVEAAPTLLCGFDLKVSTYVERELARRGVRVITSTAIQEAKQGSVVLAGGAEIAHDILIWTGGTQAPAILSTLPFVLDHGRLATDAPLTCVPKRGGTENHVYGLGDATCFHYGDTHAPWTVHVALQQANHVAKNILRRLAGEKELPFKLPRQPFVIPLGSTGGIGEYLRFPFKGRTVQLLSILAEARYLLGMLSWRDTLRIIRLRLQTL